MSALRRLAPALLTGAALIVAGLCMPGERASAAEPEMNSAAAARFGAGDYAGALAALRPRIAKGDPGAAVMGGIICGLYLRDSCDRAAARGWLEPHAEDDDGYAQFALATVLLTGRPDQRAQGRTWLARAADGGLAIARYQRGRLAWAAGDKSAARADLAAAAEADIAGAQAMLGAIERQTGNGDAAARWLTAAAEAGHTGASFQLGQLYADGELVTRDGEKAARWYEQAAQAGDTAAQHALGLLYLEGDLVPEDLFAAVWWFEKAAEARHARAQNELALLYHAGRGVRRDIRKALELFERAGNQGLAIAQYNAGLIYEGDIRLRNYGAAHHWFERAARNGFGWAMIAVGDLYHQGMAGVPRSLRQAQNWYATARKHPDAEVAAAGEARLRKAGISGLKSFFGVFGFGEAPGVGDILDSMMAMGTLERELYPEWSKRFDPASGYVAPQIGLSPGMRHANEVALVGMSMVR